MANDIRAVFDTNTLVSALLLPRSVPRRAFDHAMDNGRMLISFATVAELNDVLSRPKFDKYLSEEARMEFFAAFVREAELVEVGEVIAECRDPKDNKFLELAVSGRATHIVSGDQDLLVLYPFRGIAILNPSAFLSVA